jgi:hypothetical protein
MDDRVPAWLAYSGVIVVGGTAAVVLAWYQHLLGVRAGMPAALSWTFSIGLDWGSAVAGVFWFFTSDAGLRRWARAFSVLLIAVSTGLTCLSWGLLVGWWWAPLGAIHPLVFFGMAKLLTLWQAVRYQVRDARAKAEEEARRQREEEARREQARADKAARKETKRAPAEPVKAAPSISARMRDWIRAEIDAGREVTAAQADRQFGLTNGARVGARELRKVLKDMEKVEELG